MRKSLETANWSQATELVRNWESDNAISNNTSSVGSVTELFLADCKNRYLSAATLGKYELLFRELKARYGNWQVKSISPSELDSYRQTWKLSPISSRKKLERLRTFFKFCIERDLIRKNPAASLKPPKQVFKPTMPITDDEYEKIIWATELYPNKGIYGSLNKIRIASFVSLLNYSGLRIRDAVCLRRSSVKDGKLFLYTQKTGVPVTIPLPKFVANEMESVAANGTYFFWSGQGLPKSAVADWQRALAKLFKLAGVKCHAHQFRDRFATNLLLAGVPMESVATLLGNSVRICERHYSPWIQARQEQTEEFVKKSWQRNWKPI